MNNKGADMLVIKDARDCYDQRHGGPFDRGSADSWYSRPFNPHYYTEETYGSDRVELKDMTAEEIVAYTAGYNWNEEFGGKKEW
jgi:hypothetical protein